MHAYQARSGQVDHALLYMGTFEAGISVFFSGIERNFGMSLEKMLAKLRTIQQGWLQYFCYARMKGEMASIDGWLRCRLKCFRLKQCKPIAMKLYYSGKV